MDSHYSTETSVKLGDLNQESVSPSGVCRLNQLSPGQGESSTYLSGPSRPRKDDNFSFKVSFKLSLLPRISVATASGAAQRAEPTEEALSLNNL